MGTVAKGLLQVRWQPRLMLVRNRHKINITKPRLPHYDRALVENVCMPYFKRNKRPLHVPNYELCGTQLQEKVEKNPYEDFLARQLMNWLENSRFIGIFHTNSFNNAENFQAKLLLKKNGMRLLRYNRKVVEYAVTDTKYEPILVLFKSRTSIAVAPEPCLYDFMNIVKKLPKLVLMAAIVEDRFLSYSELNYYSSYKNLEECRMKLVGTLNAASQNLVQQLNHFPNNLVQLLDQHQQLSKDRNSEKTESSSDK